MKPYDIRSVEYVCKVCDFKGGGKFMCYNCGCEVPDDPMGQGNAGADKDGKSITNKTFEVAAKSQGMSIEDAKRNTYEFLKKELEKNG